MSRGTNNSGVVDFSAQIEIGNFSSDSLFAKTQTPPSIFASADHIYSAMSSVSSSESEGSESSQNDGPSSAVSFDISSAYEHILQNEDVRPEVMSIFGNILIA
jgi:hypothetical protein